MPAARGVNADFGLGGALLFGFNLALICGVFGSLALLISQFTQERGPQRASRGACCCVCIVVDMIHRVVPDTDWLSRLSPVYYYNLSKPLIPSYGTDPVALLVMAGPERALERRGDLALRAARYRPDGRAAALAAPAGAGRAARSARCR